MRRLLLLLALIPTTIDVVQQVPRIVPTPEAKVDTAQVKCLAVTIYGEARSESEKGQVAVAYTVLNRAVNKSLCQVALAPKQYSVFNNNPELRAAATSLHINPKQRNAIDQNSWDQALKVARMVMQKAVKDPTNGATHYIADRVMKSKGYTYPKWSRQYRVVAVIENHKFFKKA
jgi:spore germination cell wall hydrolase CwlJ-like protein